MSKLPFNLASAHLTPQGVYRLYRGELTDRWESLNETDRLRWTVLADWINERATAQVDVTERVAEKMYSTPRPELDDFDTAMPSELKNPLVGANIHDDDIAAAALRFYAEYGPKKRVDAEGNGEGLVKPADPEKVQITGMRVAMGPSSADKTSALTERLIETLGEVIVLGAKLALQK